MCQLVRAGVALACAACGDQDVTQILVTDDDALQPEPEPAQSRTFEVLSEGESLDAVCRLIGVARVSGAAGEGAEALCSDVVQQCRGTLGAALGPGDGTGPAPTLPRGDLQDLLGCPLPFAELDACVAGALDRGLDAYGGALGCDRPALPVVDAVALFAAPDCLGVILLCPELVAGLARR